MNEFAESPEEVAAREERDARRNRVTKRLGELLVGGHTMRDAACEVCSCVLMGAPGGGDTCVECELFPPEAAAASDDKEEVSVKIEPVDGSPTHHAPDTSGANVCMVAGVDIGAELQFTAACLSAKMRSLAAELRAAEDLQKVEAVCAGLGHTLDMLAKLRQL